MDSQQALKQEVTAQQQKFFPGCIIMSRSGGNTTVGVVVNNDMRRVLSRVDYSRFQKDPEGYCIYLCIGKFVGDSGRTEPFPHYGLVFKEDATVADFAGEIDLLMRHRKLKNQLDKGMGTDEPAQVKTFGFGTYQQKVLSMVAVVRGFIKRETPDVSLGVAIGLRVEDFYSELRRAIWRPNGWDCPICGAPPRDHRLKKGNFRLFADTLHCGNCGSVVECPNPG